MNIETITKKIAGKFSRSEEADKSISYAEIIGKYKEYIKDLLIQNYGEHFNEIRDLCFNRSVFYEYDCFDFYVNHRKDEIDLKFGVRFYPYKDNVRSDIGFPLNKNRIKLIKNFIDNDESYETTISSSYFEKVFSSPVYEARSNYIKTLVEQRLGWGTSYGIKFNEYVSQEDFDNAVNKVSELSKITSGKLNIASSVIKEIDSHKTAFIEPILNKVTQDIKDLILQKNIIDSLSVKGEAVQPEKDLLLKYDKGIPNINYPLFPHPKYAVVVKQNGDKRKAYILHADGIQDLITNISQRTNTAEEFEKELEDYFLNFVDLAKNFVNENSFLSLENNEKRIYHSMIDFLDNNFPYHLKIETVYHTYDTLLFEDGVFEKSILQSIDENSEDKNINSLYKI